ncbi:AtpZ/AtpI family protein [Tropicimonas sp. TH_r6]|uniref:AtpZ/AtpI family protein n=1 Tax=Tropicimonas sp. TH_r6 TaxID=3082085 RepID=UPI002952D3BA|nr:AtpZ/AtpI family protein [Tropicimonas sp. TH_r6]MDV7143250.1 AtpZ/AtpI family protein [Tropicimonas sp. TH_r6]
MTKKPDRHAEKIARHARRIADRRAHPGPSPLRGIGAFGVIGWSVAVPTVLGIALGTWLDRVAPQDFSWTLALLLGGVVLGAVLAWRWIDSEGKDR